MSVFASISRPAFSWADVAGRLVLVEPTSVDPSYTSKYTDDAGNPRVITVVHATVSILDDPQQPGVAYPDVIVFPAALVSVLARNVGQLVLARVGKGEARNGRKAPWIFVEPTDADVATGESFLAWRAGQQPQQTPQQPTHASVRTEPQVPMPTGQFEARLARQHERSNQQAAAAAAQDPATHPQVEAPAAPPMPTATVPAGWHPTDAAPF